MHIKKGAMVSFLSSSTLSGRWFWLQLLWLLLLACSAPEERPSPPPPPVSPPKMALIPPLLQEVATGSIDSLRHYLQRQQTLEMPEDRRWLNVRDGKGRTGVMVAVARGEPTRLQLLLEAGADPDLRQGESGETALIQALRRGEKDLVRLLLGAGADPERVDGHGQTPLQIAAAEGKRALVQLLLQRGAAVDGTGAGDETPLFIAVQRGYLELAQQLIRAGADIELRNGSGRTPLSYAAERGEYRLVKGLLELGADPQGGSSRHQPLSYGRKSGNLNVIQALTLASSAPHRPFRSRQRGAASESLSSALAAEGSPPSQAERSGTAIRVRRDGVLVTNYHLVRGCHTLKVGGEVVRVLFQEIDNDLALLQGPPGESAVLRQGSGIRIGERVVVAGFPLAHLLGSDIQAGSGEVSALSGLGGDPRFVQISAPVNRGNSGGPLLDASALLVGVVTARLDAAALMRELGSVPESINFALKSWVLESLLQRQGIAYLSEVPLTTLSTPDVVDLARGFTLLLECWQR
ncbi:MAG: ankyrin repeat domain-containing protein [Gammaproteobacteria bacterium]|nr:ankyrin repeat domain-containing protein [Gammaproteobacteria bacterium]